MARQNTDPDQLFVGDFKGMATAGGSYAATPEYLDYLINATTTREGTIKQRGGSRLLFAVTNSNYTEVYSFSFAGGNWLLFRYGTSFLIYKILYEVGDSEPYTLQLLCGKNNVLRTASANEPATYAVKTEGNYCHVLVATASTCLISFCFCLRDIVIDGQFPTYATAKLGQWYQLNQMNNSNTKLIENVSGNLSNTTAISNANEVLTLTWTTRPAAVVIGQKFQLVSCFWLRFADANYYRGQDLYNTALRRNTIPLDVNVEIPESLRKNYIFNEPIQDLSIESYKVYTTTTVGASSYSKVTNRQPLTNTSWDFSDGSYRAVSSQLTTPTPNYIAFGGLESNNLNNKVNVCRLRSVLVGAFEYPEFNNLRVGVDRVDAINTVFHTANGLPIVSSSDTIKYFSFQSSPSYAPGIPLESVVELVYYAETTGGTGANKFFTIDISVSQDSVFIGDGYAVPLYGYSLIARQKSFSFPNVVRVIGNRLLLSSGNRVLISSSDWNYRGISFNNCQVSTLNFNSNSPYIIDLEQDGGAIKSIASVNGVLVVLTDKYTYRISGSTYNATPNAENAVVSRLTNQTGGRNGLVVFDNQVYLANKNGLYKVAYDRNSDTGVLEEVSLPVSNLFVGEPLVVTYSNTLTSILIQQNNKPKLLRYDLLSKTWSYIQIAIPFTLSLYNDFDGFLLFGGGGNQILGAWSSVETFDLINAGVITTFTIGANTATVNVEPTNASFLVTPPELQQSIALNGVILPAYNKQSRTYPTSTTITETTAGNVPKPIISCAVTKALYGSKLTTASRVRDVELLFKNNGQAVAGITSVDNDRATPTGQRIFNISVTSAGATTITGGEYQTQNTQSTYPTTDTSTVCLSAFGISEASSIAVKLDGLEWVGFQLNSSAKATRKLQ